ncbi:MAG: ion channel [Gallionella sp.]
MRQLLEIMLGLSLTIGTLIIHGFGMYQVMHRFELNWPRYLNEKNEFRRQFYFGHLIMLMLFTHIAEILLVAAVLFGIHAFSDLRTAFYFTGETYTTIGFGDVLLPTGWRQLALFIAMSGLFSFGWSTGVLVGIVGKTYEAQFANLRKRH